MAKKPTPQELEEFDKVLRHMLSVLTGDIQDLENEALGEGQNAKSNSEDGGEAYFQELSLDLLQRDEKTVGEIADALGRLGDGSFGRCEACAKWIRKTRLVAMPHARNCIDCQREQENGAH